MTKTVFFFNLFFLVISTGLFASEQSADLIIYEGKEYLIYDYLMETYFANNPNKKPKSNVISTGLRRGYEATYEIKENQLYLKDIIVWVSDTTEIGFNPRPVSVLNQFFKDGETLKIDWVTRVLALPYGIRKGNKYLFLDYNQPCYSKYILFAFEKGRVTASKKVRQRAYLQFYKKQLDAFKKSEAYNDIITEIGMSWGFNKSSADAYLQEHILEYVSKLDQ